MRNLKVRPKNLRFAFFMTLFAHGIAVSQDAQPPIPAPESESPAAEAREPAVPGRQDTVLPAMAVRQLPLSTAFDTIAGPLPAVVKAKKNPYLVVSDIEVPAGKTVSVEKGTIFL